MIQVNQLKLPIAHTKEELESKLLHTLKIEKEQLFSFRIARQSLDARDKRNIQYVYTIEANAAQERKIIRKLHNKNISCQPQTAYQFPITGQKTLKSRPVIVGSGPAGLFCAYMLAVSGYSPIVIERGKTIQKRQEDVRRFWNCGSLNPNSNVQFGEGGAGTFSDGKLNTLVKDPAGRGRKVLEIFVKHGAPKEICYEAKPHIGTDRLAEVIPSMRETILASGGEFLFESCLTDLKIERQTVKSAQINRDTWIDTQVLALAIGHSARDTFELLFQKKVPMEAKSFAVGLRVEHLQELIGKAQYGDASALLPAASYKVTANACGRGV